LPSSKVIEGAIASEESRISPLDFALHAEEGGGLRERG